MQLQTKSIIRDRGQLTIPDFIRGRIDWVSPGSVVTISQLKDDEIIIRPHVSNKNEFDWNKLWRNIELARSHRGTYKGSLSEFIVSDRDSH